MPRKIPDLELKILEAAQLLFLTKGYLDVSMKQVACEAGTSVGNLYNYFPTKKDLFVAGRLRGLEEFHERFSQVPEGIDPLTAIGEMLLLLMEGMEKWSGLLEDFLLEVSVNLPLEEARSLQQLMKEEFHRYIVPQIEAALRRLSPVDSGLEALINAQESRLAIGLISLVKFLVKTFPNAGQLNRDFLKDLLQRLLNPFALGSSINFNPQTEKKENT